MPRLAGHRLSFLTIWTIVDALMDHGVGPVPSLNLLLTFFCYRMRISFLRTTPFHTWSYLSLGILFTSFTNNTLLCTSWWAWNIWHCTLVFIVGLWQLVTAIYGLILCIPYLRLWPYSLLCWFWFYSYWHNGYPWKYKSWNFLCRCIDVYSIVFILFIRGSQLNSIMCGFNES